MYLNSPLFRFTTIVSRLIVTVSTFFPLVGIITIASSVQGGAAGVQFVWSGAVTTQSALVKAKLISDSTAARLAVSLQSDLSFPIYSNWDTSITVNNNRVVSFAIGGLNSNSQYYYGVEIGGTVDPLDRGQFHTFPADTETFTFALGSCAQIGSNHAVFQTIKSKNPLFFFHLGDMHYQNIGVNDINLFRQALETVLNNSNQAALYRSVSLAYMWDDHDFGPNNSDSTAAGRTASRLTYQEYVPHYPLAAGTGNIPIYYAFSVGRVRFIVCDSRSARSPFSATDNSSKTMLGVQQKVWFKQELLDASTSHALIVWVNTLPWIGITGDDGWYGYSNERAELSQFLQNNNITNLCMISGDAHMLAIDDGTNSYYGSGGGTGFPVFHAAALDQTPSLKGGPYSEGAYPGPGKFGLMTVIDETDTIKVQWSGRNHLDSEVVAFNFAYPVGLVTDIGDGDNHNLPKSYVLNQNYPNPFNPTTTIGFVLPRRSFVKISIHNILGQQINALVNSMYSAGLHTVIWDGTDSSGNLLPSGVYLYRMVADEFVETKKMIFAK